MKCLEEVGLETRNNWGWSWSRARNFSTNLTSGRCVISRRMAVVMSQDDAPH